MDQGVHSRLYGVLGSIVRVQREGIEQHLVEVDVVDGSVLAGRTVDQTLECERME